MPSADQALPEGHVLEGEYVIERVLGRGGFGITYLARHQALNMPVAIKEFFPTSLASRTEQATLRPQSEADIPTLEWGKNRFIKEAQALAVFRHPNIVRVSRVFSGNGTAYAVLDYEGGSTLKDWLGMIRRPMTQDEIDRIARPLLGALEAIHEKHLLHRDISTDNIIMRNDGSPVLIDFGAVKDVYAANSGVTHAVVKRGYSPIEQYDAGATRQGPWTDIYALAATFYCAIAGQAPPESINRTLEDQMRPASDFAGIGGGYRPGFLAAIDHALAIRPEQRPASVAAWRAELFEGPQTGEAGKLAPPFVQPPVAAPPTVPPPVSAPGSASAGGTEAVPAPMPRPSRPLPRNTLAWAGAAMTAIGLAGLLVASIPAMRCRVSACPDPPRPIEETVKPPTPEPPPVPSPAPTPAPQPIVVPPSLPRPPDELPRETAAAVRQLEACTAATPCNLTGCLATFARGVDERGRQRAATTVGAISNAANEACRKQREESAFAELQACSRDLPCAFVQECLDPYRKAAGGLEAQRAAAIAELERGAQSQCLTPPRR